MSDDEEPTDPEGRELRVPCGNGHGMLHGYYTRDDGGKLRELRCTWEKDCNFSVQYTIRWPKAFKMKPVQD
jgi:hypothetical protein